MSIASVVKQGGISARITTFATYMVSGVEFKTCSTIRMPALSHPVLKQGRGRLMFRRGEVLYTLTTLASEAKP